MILKAQNASSRWWFHVPLDHSLFWIRFQTASYSRGRILQQTEREHQDRNWASKLTSRNHWKAQKITFPFHTHSHHTPMAIQNWWKEMYYFVIHLLKYWMKINTNSLTLMHWCVHWLLRLWRPRSRDFPQYTSEGATLYALHSRAPISQNLPLYSLLWLLRLLTQHSFRLLPRSFWGWGLWWAASYRLS